MQNYGRYPIALDKGAGALVWDIAGKQYIDCVAGIAVNNVGHCHPKVVKAIQEQAAKLIHVSNLYYTNVQADLAEKLSQVTGMDRLFFCNSGTEAVEAAMKLARAHSGKKNFVAAEGSFHGRTMGALAVTSKEAYRKPFEPLSGRVDFVPYDNSPAIADAIDSDTAAVILEPIQGEGGVNVPSSNYLKEVREICDETDTLLIFDEVQTGFGRTGKWFCKDYFNVSPDIMTMAKALGGGFPMGAIASREGIVFQKGQHAATFGGGPLACAAALASINAIEKEGLVERSRIMGEYFVKKLEGLNREDFLEIRGKGLMMGVRVKDSCAEMVTAGLEKGVLLNCTAGNILRMVPPLVITEEQVDSVVDVIGKL
ncbi:acetylornithine transaminase [Methanohalophilus portucalensis]|nr:acetylornithine transaminase [Methanohalophilus portucalensis]OJH49948.1 acetylornithine aminotransferase apoenzyme [Methanohalophilus portucalensis FDF-1]